MQLVGLDAGNSESTLVWERHGEPVLLTIPSYIGSGSLTELTRIRGGAGGDLLRPGEYVLEHDHKTMFVGQLALDEARDASSARNDITRYWNGHTLRLLLVLAAEAGLTHIRVMTGLPVAVWTPENRRAVQQALQGRHDYRISTPVGTMETRTLTIDAVAVMMESASVLAQLAVEDAEYGVIDIGGRTTDLFWSRGVRPVARLCEGFEAGVEKAGDLLRQTVLDTTGRGLSFGEVRSVLRAHADNAPAPRLSHKGQPMHLNGQVQASIDAVASDIAQHVSARWGDARGQVATSADRVLLIGGGAHYFAPALQQLIPQLEVMTAPEHANALGYYAIASRASDAAWARNRV